MNQPDDILVAMFKSGSEAVELYQTASGQLEVRRAGQVLGQWSLSEMEACLDFFCDISGVKEMIHYLRFKLYGGRIESANWN